MPHPSLTTQTPIRVASGLHERRVGDKVFVLDQQSVMHAFDNAVAVAIWDLLQGASEVGISSEAITNEIVTHFDVSVEDARADVWDFVQLLLAREIVTKAH